MEKLIKKHFPEINQLACSKNCLALFGAESLIREQEEINKLSKEELREFLKEKFNYMEVDSETT